jgi:putative phage-type endonuclease
MDLGDRKKYIGGSDISAVMGLSRYKTPLQIWGEKTGLIEPKDLSDNEYVYWGTKHEETIAQEFEKRTGLEILDGEVYTHSEYPYMVAHTDRTVYNHKSGINSVLECKTASRSGEWKVGEIPQEYILQVNWYMGLSGLHHAYIACLITGNKYVIKEMQFDGELFETQVSVAKDFWRMVEQKIMPDVRADDADTLLELYPFANSESVTVSNEELDNSVAYLSEKEIELKEIEKEIDTIKNEIKALMGETEVLITDKYVLSWKNQVTKRVDVEKVKEAGLFEEYSKESNTRVLRKKARA